ncbi:piggyBac transposable element-derived protein 3-like isoform X1 [Periplaneta americana]|uniref:piggyBac transposable element-derived protein 3-like isoform X1 n=1 Tax=Periplaneta americana TaxID=6978 RepID=UPI0037E761FA
MDMIKKEPDVDPLAILSSDNTDKDENKPLLEEGNFMDSHVAGIKTECVDDSHDFTSEFKVEETAVPNNVIAMKFEPEIPFRGMAGSYDVVFKGITLEDALDIVNDDTFANEVDVQSEKVDIVVLPPDPDSLTDEDEAPDDVTGVANVKDVPGPVEVHFIASENADCPEISTSMSEKPTKKIKLCKQTAKYEKCTPKYTKILENDHTSHETLEEIKNNLKNCTPLEIGEKILNYNDMFDFIVKETVSYAVSCKNIFDFTLDPDELRVFLGILLLSGYHRLPSERHYWSEEADLGLDIVKNAMSRNQFLKLKSLIHFNDNTDPNDQNHNKGFKVRPLMSMLNAAFQQFGIFSEHLAIGEMIVKYYGHNSLKQLIRGKPIRFGYKLWALCGSNGYCYKFDLYCGKDAAGSDVSNRHDLALGTKVVLNMLDCIVHPRAHDIYFDNFFTSRDLLLHLQDLGFRATGTVRENRMDGCPLQDTKLLQKSVRGSYDYSFDINGEILFVKWNDNRSVTVASNFDVVEPVASASRWNRNARQKISVQQPLVIKNYNKYIGGVDHHDCLAGKYATAIRCKKWYWALFVRMLDMAVVNGWIIYREIHGRDALDLLEFRRCLAVQYLKMFTNRKRMERPLSSPRGVQFDMRFDGRGHFMAKRPSQRHCRMAGCKGRPVTFCKKCDVTLCQRCFEPYHSR